MAKKRSGRCIYPGCDRVGTNILGVRLRKPDDNLNAVWSHETGAHVCNHHARMGMRLIIQVELLDELKVKSHVTHEGGNDELERLSSIKPSKLPPEN